MTKYINIVISLLLCSISKSMYVEVDLQQGLVCRISQTIVNNELCSYLLLKNLAQMCDPVHGTLLCSN